MAASTPIRAAPCGCGAAMGTTAAAAGVCTAVRTTWPCRGSVVTAGAVVRTTALLTGACWMLQGGAPTDVGGKPGGTSDSWCRRGWPMAEVAGGGATKAALGGGAPRTGLRASAGAADTSTALGPGAMGGAAALLTGTTADEGAGGGCTCSPVAMATRRGPSGVLMICVPGGSVTSCGPDEVLTSCWLGCAVATTTCAAGTTCVWEGNDTTLVRTCAGPYNTCEYHTKKENN